MKPTKLRQKTLSALIVLIFSPILSFALTSPGLPDAFLINSPDALMFLKNSNSAAPVAVPAPSPVAAGEPDSDYDFDENGDEQNDPADNHPVRLDGDGFVTILNNKTGQTLSLRYRDGAGNYRSEAAKHVSSFFRCRLSDEEHDIAPGLLEILDSLQHKFGDNKTITLLSGYRSPELNAALGRNGSGVAKHSLHMSGMAADINIPGVPLAALRDAAHALQVRNTGGVGYYPANGFVHVDTGRVRSWSGKARVLKHKRTKHGHARAAHGRKTPRTK